MPTGMWIALGLLVAFGLVVLLIYVVREAAVLKKTAEGLQAELRGFKEGGFDRLVQQKLGPLTQKAEEARTQLLEEEQQRTKATQQIQRDLGHVTAQISQLKELQGKVGELNDLLKPQQLRGELGEVIVRNLIADKLPASQYVENYTFADGKQVEFALKLMDRLIPVDAKLPLDDFKRMREATDERQRASFRNDFKRTVKRTIDEVKAYIRPNEGTTNFALIVIPSEAVFYDLTTNPDFAETGGVWLYAQERKIFLTSPSTFWAYLSAIAQGLRGLEIERHAEEILRRLQGLAGKLQHFSQDEFRKLGAHLSNATKQYEEADRRLRDIEDALAQLERTEVEPLSQGGVPA